MIYFSIILSLIVLPINSLAFDFESKTVLERGVWPNALNYGDSIFEISDEGLSFIISDTLGQVGRYVSVDATPGINDHLVAKLPLENGFYEMVVSRATSGNGDYWWPYLYRLHPSDTGLVVNRFREIDLPRTCFVIDAKSVSNGDYIILYSDRDERTWSCVSRITEAGEIIWTESILENVVYRGTTWSVCITASTNDPSQYYVLSRTNHSPPGPFFAHVTLIDTLGDIHWVNEYRWPGSAFGFELTAMESFEDGTYGIVGTGTNLIVYLHLGAGGENLGLFTYHSDAIFGDSEMKSLVIDGERLLIKTEIENEEDYPLLGLIYLNEEGDSLDSYLFNPDTIRSDRVGPMLLRPNGKVLLWAAGYYWDRWNRRQNSDILYTFYPDGRPGAVDMPIEFTPSTFSLSAFPNPFNSTLTIRYAGGLETAATRLAIYDISGRLVADFPTLLAGGELKGGSRSVTWNASSVGAGVYFVRLTCGPNQEIQKLLYLE